MIATVRATGCLNGYPTTAELEEFLYSMTDKLYKDCSKKLDIQHPIQLTMCSHGTGLYIVMTASGAVL